MVPAPFSRCDISDPSTGTQADSPFILAIANQKGGVGKTTTAVNLAASLAQSGLPTLLVDLDPQGNASTGLGITRRLRRNGSYALLDTTSGLTPLLAATRIDNLQLIPADPDLAGAEIELVGSERREYRLRTALRDTTLPGTFAAIILDCPPSLGLLTLNALVAADSIMVPLQCEFYALEGVSHLTATIERVRRALNRDLILEGIVLTMFDRRNNLSELVADDARGFFGSAVFETVIPRNVRLSEAPSHGIPISLYDPRSPGAAAYRNLAVEFLDRRRRRLA